MSDRTREETEGRIMALCQEARVDEATRVALEYYGPEILGWLIGVVKDETAAEDICQHFSIALWKGLPSFRWESSLRVWAYKIAWHELIRFQKAKEKRKEQQFNTSEISGLAQAVTSLHMVLRKKQEASRLVELRQELPEEMQTLIILRIDREMSFGEIAQVLEIEEDTARQKFKRAKDKLKELAKKEGLLS